MIRHIEPFDNKNKPIVDIDNKIVPLVYFNRLFLNSNASTTYNLENHETMIVVVKGKVCVEVDDVKFSVKGQFGFSFLILNRYIKTYWLRGLPLVVD